MSEWIWFVGGVFVGMVLMLMWTAGGDDGAWYG